MKIALETFLNYVCISDLVALPSILINFCIVKLLEICDSLICKSHAILSTVNLMLFFVVIDTNYFRLS